MSGETADVGGQHVEEINIVEGVTAPRLNVQRGSVYEMKSEYWYSV